MEIMYSKLKIALLICAISATSSVATSPVAHAEIDITRSRIVPGSISIRGRFAPPNAQISWEGQDTGEVSRPNGRFRFNTRIRPADCVGRLKIGDEERDVVIGNCGAQGARGPQGPEGPKGDPGPVLGSAQIGRKGSNDCIGIAPDGPDNKKLHIRRCNDGTVDSTLFIRKH
jgi:hypothetical protein